MSPAADESKGRRRGPRRKPAAEPKAKRDGRAEKSGGTRRARRKVPKLRAGEAIALASAILLAEHPNLKSAALLAVAVWAFARAYYFAFYVIEHYLDPGYRYQGLLSFARHLIRRGKGRMAAGEWPSEGA